MYPCRSSLIVAGTLLHKNNHLKRLFAFGPCSDLMV